MLPHPKLDLKFVPLFVPGAKERLPLALRSSAHHSVAAVQSMELRCPDALPFQVHLYQDAQQSVDPVLQPVVPAVEK